ncbi:MAG TPA: HD domain-containing protein [Candidatus Saccharimonadales bacterium]|nr:HD domain-containing protein [Candidatus Saccharimonadales bacterium]
MDIQEVLSFCELLVQFGEVDRRLLLPSGTRDENDAEHSYTLAMTAWYIITKAKLPLDVNRALKYALAHDLIETYAGDTFIYDKARTSDKAHREHLAAEILQRNYPDFEELHQLIQRYEQRSDDEARFIYALDKVIPVLIIYLGGGKSWQRDKITLEMLRRHKQAKVAESATVANLWEQLLALLEKQPELFGSTAATRNQR